MRLAVYTNALHDFSKYGLPVCSPLSGGGCMLSALCTLFLCTDTSAFDAVRAAGALWRETALEAGRRTDAEKSGIGSFHVHLFDVLEEKLMYTSKHKF